MIGIMIETSVNLYKKILKIDYFTGALLENPTIILLLVIIIYDEVPIFTLPHE